VPARSTEPPPSTVNEPCEVIVEPASSEMLAGIEPSVVARCTFSAVESETASNAAPGSGAAVSGFVSVIELGVGKLLRALPVRPLVEAMVAPDFTSMACLATIAIWSAVKLTPLSTVTLLANTSVELLSALCRPPISS
jgi:hypothetical protein